MQLPADFLQNTRQMMGAERFERFMRAFEEEPPVSIRLNPLKLPGDGGYRIVDGSESVPWCASGYYLPHRPPFTFDPLLHAGCYYVQEAASMFLDEVLRQHLPQGEPLAFLDLCAAPGGKSTLIRSALSADSLLVSNEPVRKRAQVLAENMTKWGHGNTLVTNNLPEDFSRSRLMFDAILCDVPCSGEGMFRRDEAVVSQWSPEAIERCSRLQRRIVSEAWQCLRPGGLFIYSTCTFNIKEDEANVQWMAENLEAEMLGVDTEERWAVTGSLLAGFSLPVYRFIPGITRSEGLFMAVMRKPPAAGHCGSTPADAMRKVLSALKGGTLNAVTRLHSPTPPHSVATVDLSYAMAVSYLRGEAIVLPPCVARGPVSVSFRGHVLGQVKNIGSRANNLYPKEWRIKSTHVPGEYQESIIINPSQKKPYCTHETIS